MGSPIWLRHDSDARNDPKILLLRSRCGPAGYGLFWMLVEYLCEQEGYRIEEQYLPGLAVQFGVDYTILEDFIECALSAGLLERETGRIGSPALDRRMESYDRQRETNRQNSLKRWKKKERPEPHVTHTAETEDSREEDPDRMRAESKRSAPANQIKIKSKSKSKSKREDREILSPSSFDGRGFEIFDENNPQEKEPSLEDVLVRAQMIGVSPEDAETFYNHYKASGWRSGNDLPIQHWPSKLKSWSNEQQSRRAKQDGRRAFDIRDVARSREAFLRRITDE